VRTIFADALEISVRLRLRVQWPDEIKIHCSIYVILTRLACSVIIWHLQAPAKILPALIQRGRNEEVKK